MNVYDSERMGEALVARGMTESAQEDADVIVLNTCHVRERAAEKVYHEVGRIAARARHSGKERPVIAVAGCVAQAEGEEILHRAKAVDLVIGPQAYHRLPGLLDQQQQQGSRIVDLDMPADSKFGQLPKRMKRAPSVFLTVQEGCDKFCSFCVVPYTRGAQVSRPLQDILDEAHALVAGGAREIMLLGQNVNAWADEKHDFGTLLRSVAAINGVARLRYTTSHPRDVTPDMIAAHADIPQLMPYLHLPAQSGSDRILKAMNRKYDCASYLDLIRKFRAARPDIALTSDFIVGYPGETEEDFQQTLDLVAKVGYAQAYSFKYSPRLGTPAAEEEDQISEDVKTERLHRLQALLAQSALAFNQSMVGAKTSVLIERKGRQQGQWIGKSPWLQSVVLNDPDLERGDLVDVELIAAGPNSLEGRLLAAETVTS